jgi:diadenosine tetraphosphatase ApaH/serine/threonine PP2A family protein phosphatase
LNEVIGPAGSRPFFPHEGHFHDLSFHNCVAARAGRRFVYFPGAIGFRDAFALDGFPAH